MIVVMNSAYKYTAEINGKPAQWTERVPGALELILPEGQGEVLIKQK